MRRPASRWGTTQGRKRADRSLPAYGSPGAERSISLRRTELFTHTHARALKYLPVSELHCT